MAPLHSRERLRLALLIGLCSASIPAALSGQTVRREESDSERMMAEMMAQQMDEIWDEAPEAGTANVRILITRDGRPFAGMTSIYTEFSFRADARAHYSQGFNPNANGRWVYEGLDPGEYQITVAGVEGERFEGFEWSETFSIAAGSAPLLEIGVPAPQ
jgi:hypothetical protein